jgi:hypothetical protein
VTTVETPAFRSVVGRHRRPAPRLLAALRLAVAALAAYVVQAYVVGPVLVDAIGLPVTVFVTVLASVAVLFRRR